MTHFLAGRRAKVLEQPKFLLALQWLRQRIPVSTFLMNAPPGAALRKHISGRRDVLSFVVTAVLGALVKPHASEASGVKQLSNVMDGRVARDYMEKAKEKNPLIVDLLELVSEDSIYATLTHLTEYNTRNTWSAELADAAEWSVDRFQQFGFDVSRHKYWEGIPANVIAELRGTEMPDSIIVLGAHLDSTSTNVKNSTLRAPGADDDGSGVASVLEFAKILFKSGLSFKKTIRLCLFTGEEQGTVGSKALARQWADDGVKIDAYINLDMIGYLPPSGNITITFPTTKSDQALTSIGKQVVRTYLPSKYLIGERIPCCGDDSSFFNKGFPVTAIHETPPESKFTPLNPNMHSANDIIATINMEQIKAHSSAAFALIALLAEPIQATKSKPLIDKVLAGKRLDENIPSPAIAAYLRDCQRELEPVFGKNALTNCI